MLVQDAIGSRHCSATGLTVDSTYSRFRYVILQTFSILSPNRLIMMQRESWSDDTATREFEPLRFPKARFARVTANADAAEGTL